jgi:hypothetical protein
MLGNLPCRVDIGDSCRLQCVATATREWFCYCKHRDWPRAINMSLLRLKSNHLLPTNISLPEVIFNLYLPTSLKSAAKQTRCHFVKFFLVTA